jgi:hypothetical protein
MAGPNSVMKYFSTSRRVAARSRGNGGALSSAAAPSPVQTALTAEIVPAAAQVAAPSSLVVPDFTVLADSRGRGAAEGSSRKRNSRKSGNKTWKAEYSSAFPWAEPQFDACGLVMYVKCAVCSEINDRPLLIKNKRDNLMKHCGNRRARTRFQLNEQVVEMGDT